MLIAAGLLVGGIATLVGVVGQTAPAHRLEAPPPMPRLAAMGSEPEPVASVSEPVPVAAEPVAADRPLPVPRGDAGDPPAGGAGGEGVLPAATPEGLSFIAAHRAGQPALRYALDVTPAGFALHLRPGAAPGAEGLPELELAIGAQGVDDLHRHRLTVTADGDGPATASLRQRWAELGLDAAPGRLHLAVRVVWRSDRFAQPLRVERYFVSDQRGPSAALPTAVDEVAAIDLEEHRLRLEDDRQRITIALDQPMAGRMSVVIEDADGRRLRNLVSGADAEAGRQVVAWDGRDEDGRLVDPGSYRWRSLHHPGIRAEYLMSYANGRLGRTRPFGTNHGVFGDACTNGELLFLAAALTEGGYAMVAYDAEGTWRHGYNVPHGTPHHDAVVAADGRFLYAAHVGPDPATAAERRHNPNWRGEHVISLTRFEIGSGKVVRFDGKREFHFVHRFEAPVHGASDLHGLEVLGDALYLASTSAGLIELDKASGDERRRIAVDAIGPVARRGDELLVTSGDAVHALRGDRLGPAICRREGGDIVGLTCGDDGAILVSDRALGQVVAYDADGDERRRYGRGGGAYAGRYDPERLVLQAGICAFAGRLVVCELRRLPKRFLQFDLTSGEVVDERFGNPPYGGNIAGFDQGDPTRWVGMGAQWSIDVAAGEDAATVTDVFFAKGGHFGGAFKSAKRYRYHREDGRTFLIGEGFINTVSELQADGSLRDLAAFSSIHSFDYGCEWRPPQAVIDAVQAAGASLKDHGHMHRGLLWVDGDGDGQLQASEIRISPPGTRFAASRWGNNGIGLDLTTAVVRGDETALVILEPDGFNPVGAPRYPDFEQAIAGAAAITGLPMRLPGGASYELLRDRFGTVLVNEEPWMLGLGADGALRWRFPNRWVGVHGSHKAPLPEQGVMQGALMFLGRAELDAESDVTVLNGNHGRFFWLTTDGFYLDETFRDVRMGGSRDDQWIAGEPFGGFFARADDGRYFLITGGDGYRIYRIHGLEAVRRQAGEVAVSHDQILAAERRLARAAAAEEPRVASLAVAAGITVDGRVDEWKGKPKVSWAPAAGIGATAWLAADAETLYLAYKVTDPSPWRNRGPDWQTMFKTGDSVDLQLGTDPAADPKRREPVPGDLRLLFAPDGDGAMAVRYRHRLADGGGERVTFTSPWRSEVVDDVRRLESARVAVRREPWGYYLEAAVPLADLGWAPRSQATYRLDLGVIYGDAEGTINQLRSYWSNRATGLVNDVPGEIMLHPDRWGELTVEGGR